MAQTLGARKEKLIFVSELETLSLNEEDTGALGNKVFRNMTSKTKLYLTSLRCSAHRKQRFGATASALVLPEIMSFLGPEASHLESFRQTRV